MATLPKSEITRRALVTFETKTCGRCQGSGEYSYCQTWGHTCFKCGYLPGVRGTGRSFTKRGLVAREFFVAQLPRKQAQSLVPGELFLWNEKVRTVVAVRPSTSAVVRDGVAISEGYLDIETPNVTYSLVPVAQECEMVPEAEQVEAALAAALAYQETLTKSGTERKRKAA